METEEVIAAKLVVSSRSRQQPQHEQQNGCAIRKVQAEFVEYTSDTLHTSFIFTVPMDGPCTFSNNLFSIAWYICFEFITVAKGKEQY